MQGLNWRSTINFADGVTGSTVGCGNFHSGPIDSATAVALGVKVPFQDATFIAVLSRRDVIEGEPRRAVARHQIIPQFGRC
jgi:hypothetical protein